MYIYWPNEFTNWAMVWDYFEGLRTGIAPVLSFLEITNFLLTSNTFFITKHAYHVMLTGMLVLPVIFLKRTWVTFLFFFPLIVLLLLAIELILRDSIRMIYDAAYPFFLLLSIYLTKLSFSSRREIFMIALALLGGFFLSMAELSRPFMLLMLPFIGTWVVVNYWQLKLKRLAIWFFIPIMVLSGTWHLKLIVKHNQLIWSNHSGCNLANAWAPLIDFDTRNALMEPEEPPLFDAPWKWHNLNTEVHTQNCNRVRAYVIQQIGRQPWLAVKTFVRNTIRFCSAQTAMYENDPQSPILDIYRWIVRITFIFFPLWLVSWFRSLKSTWKKLLSIESLMLFLLLCLCFFPIIGEHMEAARFLISVLPFLSYALVKEVEFILSLKDGRT